MHLAPIPIFYFNNLKIAIKLAGDSSKTTHAHRLTIDACKYMPGLIVGTIMEHSKDEILSKRYSPVLEYWDAHELAPEIDEIACGSFKYKNPLQIKGADIW